MFMHLGVNIHATCPAHLVRLDLTLATSHYSLPLSILRSNTNVYVLGQCETTSFTPIQQTKL